jgi:SAM-dependent methyltransferase
LTQKNFKNYANFYDFINQDKDYKKEALYIAENLKRHGNKNGSVLEFGSGTGKHGKILASMGYKVHGVELSKDMIRLAKPSKNFTCQQGDACKVRLNKKFDSVIALFHVASYQITKTQINNFLSNALRHLKKGGVFIFDFWYEPAVLSQKPSLRIKKRSNQDFIVTRIAEPKIFPNKKIVNVHYTFFVEDKKNKKISKFIETHSMRYFSLGDLDLLSKRNKLVRVGAEEFLTKKKPSKQTWGICVALKEI